MPKRIGHKNKSPYESRRRRTDPRDAVQDARSQTRYEWSEADVADDAAEAFRWGFTADGR